MTKKLFIALCLMLSTVINAEPAFHSKLVLSNVQSVLAVGFVQLDVIQGTEVSAEIFIREGAVSNVKIGIETIAERRTLVVKEMTKITQEHWDEKPIAHVIVTLTNLEHVQAINAYLVTVKGVIGNGLSVSSAGMSNLVIEGLEYQTMKFDLKDSTLAKLDKINVNDFHIKQFGASKVGAKDIVSHNLYARLYDNSRFSLSGFETNKAHFFGTFQTQFNLKAPVKISEATIVANRKAKMFLSQADVEVLTVDAKNQAKVELGQSKLLNIYARNESFISFLGEPVLSVKKRNKAVVKQVPVNQEREANE